MRLYTTSHGLDPSRLEPGADLVLELDEAHGIDAPTGVLAHDHLSMDDRRAVDAAVTEQVHAWTAALEDELTVNGVRLAWIWELNLITDVFMPTITDALALDRALERHRPSEVVVADRDPSTAALARAVAGPRGIAVSTGDGSAVEVDHGEARHTPVHVRLRRTLVRSLLVLGVPSRVHRGAVLMLAYWPLMPLLDRMLTEDGRRPAVWLLKLPSGPKRALRAALRGGWVGTPGPRDRAVARRQAAGALAAAERATPRLEPFGLAIGELLHQRALARVRARAATDLALTRLFRRVLARGRLTRVLVPYDVDPDMRLIVSLAREAGVPTLVVAHGAYPLRHTVVDFQVSDEVALWSTTFGPTIWRYDRPLHVVGYPLPHEPRESKPAPAAASKPRVLVLGHGRETQTSLFDDRFAMRHYNTAVEAVAATFPQAHVVLRPHPSESVSAVNAFAEHVHDISIEVDRSGSIEAALERSDLCIGTPSTATFQAALAGTPVVVLNVSGYDWCWPLGGITSVPIAHSRAELERYIEAWRSGSELPGRADLLAAIGANGGDATEKLLALLD